MHSELVVIDIHTDRVIRESLTTPSKIDAFHAGYERAKYLGYYPIRTYTTTVSYQHFVVVFGDARSRRAIAQSRPKC